MNLADALVTTLRDMQLRYLFGVSGANIEHVHDAVYRLGNGQFQTVMTKSEYGAAFMADVRARLHRTLGVCCATSGGGMMNLAVGIAESYAQAVPVLALVGQPPLAQEGCGAFQDSSGKGDTVNALQLWSAIAKYVCKVTDPADFWALLREAVTQPLLARCGPAVMLIPRDLMMAEVGPRPADFPLAFAPARDTGSESAEAPLQSILQELAQAQCPLLIAGAGIAREGVQHQLMQWVNSTGIQVATTLSCSNAFPQEHPHYIGMIGAAGHPSAHDFLENEADYVMALGTQLRAMNRATLERALQRKPLAVINSAITELDAGMQPRHVVKSGLAPAIQQLNFAQQCRPLRWNHAASPVLRHRPRPVTEPKDMRTGLTQHAALTHLQPFMASFHHVLFDAGNCAAAAAHYLQVPSQCSATIALGMGGMGFAIAGAVGAQLGEANSRTLVIGGDGAFLMTGFEIHTAVHLRLPILWVIFNNNQHGMCVTRQQLYFGGRIEGNTYSTVDIARVARGLGGAGDLWCASVHSAASLPAALMEYLERAPGPGVLELKIHDDTLPPFMPFLLEKTRAM